MDFTLIADIGGTNIRLALVNKQENILYSKNYKCADYPLFIDVLKEYFKETKIIPKQAIVAVAAAIMEDHVVMTNHNWEFSIKELKKELNLDFFKVINDFEAQAMSVEYLTLDDIKIIHKGTILDDSTNSHLICRNIAGPGTGFGNALLYKNNNIWNIIPTEIGHSIIGSCTDLEQEIFHFVKKTYDIKEPYGELFVSGNGILKIYNALRKINGINPNDSVFYTNSADITLNIEKDALSQQTMEVFYGLLGTIICNIALSYLPYAGIYLTGGIIPKTLNKNMETILVERFLDRKLTTVKAILQKIPIYLITKENPAMLGLAKYSTTLSNKD